MQKKLTIFSFLMICALFTQAQILFQEDFEGGSIPAGWTNVSDATDGGFLVGTPAALSSQYFEIIANGSSRIAATNDDECNCDKGDEYFITPPIDLTGQTSVILTFESYYNDNQYQGAQEEASVEVSTDGGTTWQEIEDLHGHGGWDTHSIDLSDFAGESAVSIGFHYKDDGSWMYGFGIDNITVEVPLALDAEMAEVSSRIFGEVNTPLDIKGIVYNNGISTITSMEITYTVDGGSPISETISGLSIPSFSYYNFATTTPWTPDSAGDFDITVDITAVNGGEDGNLDNNDDSFNTEIFAEVIVPNKIDEYIAAPAIFTEVTGAASGLDKPTDLDFFPILGKNELWVINQRTEDEGGSTLTIADATTDAPSDFDERVDGNSWHFMSLPTGIAFSDDNFNFANSAGVQDANHGGGTFTGPALWSSDPDVYAQPSGGNGSHLDMLHGSPFSMGIAHETENVFWVYDDWNKDIVRYDFAEDHGPGNDDHADAIIRRYKNIGIDADGDIPNHMILDKASGWLYFVDNGNDRVVRLDINSGTGMTTLAEINEPLAEHSQVNGFVSEVIIDTDLDRPCGIEIFENTLYVGDYATGEIIAYDMENGFEELTRIETGAAGLTGIKIGPDGNLWFVNRIENTLQYATPGVVSATNDVSSTVDFRVSPNPTSGQASVYLSGANDYADAVLTLTNLTGQQVFAPQSANAVQRMDLSNLPTGVYVLTVQSSEFTVSRKVVLQGK